MIHAFPGPAGRDQKMGDLTRYAALNNQMNFLSTAEASFGLREGNAGGGKRDSKMGG
jgi:hypothetical protein